MDVENINEESRRKGRPLSQINADKLEQLLAIGFSVTEIANKGMYFLLCRYKCQV